MDGAEQVEEALRARDKAHFERECDRLREMGYRVVRGCKGGKEFFFARKPGRPVFALQGFHKFLIRRLRSEKPCGWTCCYCPKLLRFGALTPTGKAAHDAATLEHRQAKKKGGTYKRTNLALACYSCNKDKGDLPEALFVELKAKYGDRHAAFRKAQSDQTKRLKAEAESTISLPLGETPDMGVDASQLS